MTTAVNLVGLGVPAEIAKRTGCVVLSVTASTTTQGTGGGNLTGIDKKLVLATLTAGQSITLPANAETGQEVQICNVSGAAGVIFPHVGGTLNQLSANASTAIAANASALCIKISANGWRVLNSAAIA